METRMNTARSNPRFWFSIGLQVEGSTLKEPGGIKLKTSTNLVGDAWGPEASIAIYGGVKWDVVSGLPAYRAEVVS